MESEGELDSRGGGAAIYLFPLPRPYFPQWLEALCRWWGRQLWGCRGSAGSQQSQHGWIPLNPHTAHRRAACQNKAESACAGTCARLVFPSASLNTCVHKPPHSLLIQSHVGLSVSTNVRTFWSQARSLICENTCGIPCSTGWILMSERSFAAGRFSLLIQIFPLGGGVSHYWH